MIKKVLFSAVIMFSFFSGNAFKYGDLNRFFGDLNHREFYDLDLSKANLFGLDLADKIVSYVNFDKANLRCACLNNSFFFHCKFNGALLMESELEGANFCECEMVGANLSDANLNSVIFDKKSNEGIVLFHTYGSSVADLAFLDQLSQ